MNILYKYEYIIFSCQVSWSDSNSGLYPFDTQAFYPIVPHRYKVKRNFWKTFLLYTQNSIFYFHVLKNKSIAYSERNNLCPNLFS